MSLELNYFITGLEGTRNPSPVFYSNEYLLLNPDVKAANINPLVHYDKFGINERRNISLADKKPAIFPKDAISIEKEFFTRNDFSKKKITILACFSGNGLIPEHLLYLVKGLKEISDYLIIIGDNPIFEKETEKLKDYCNYCIFTRHEEYDFGSYKRGYRFLQENNILHEDDDLIFVNDSCYALKYAFIFFNSFFDSDI